jgi:hypothetical protein
MCDMARVRSVLDIKASPDEVWALVTDWPAHGRWIPFTVVTIDDDSPRLVWTEDVSPRWTPKFADALVSMVGKVLFDGTLRKFAAELDG